MPKYLPANISLLGNDNWLWEWQCESGYILGMTIFRVIKIVIIIAAFAALDGNIDFPDEAN